MVINPIITYIFLILQCNMDNSPIGKVIIAYMIIKLVLNFCLI